MKKLYSKPTITVETMQLDQPLCATCMADRDDLDDLLSFGYFSAEDGCKNVYSGEKYDTICYHSNIQTAFSS